VARLPFRRAGGLQGAWGQVANVRRLRNVALAVVSAVAAAILGGHPAFAQDGVTIEVLPGTARVSREGEVNVLVVVRNATQEQVYLTRLGVLEPADNVRMDTSLPKLLPETSAVAIDAVISTSGGRPIEGSITMWTGWASNSDATSLDGIASVEIPLAERDPPPMADALEVSVRSGASEIDDQRGGNVTLVVKNVSTDRVHLTEIDVRIPSFVKVCYLHPSERSADSESSEGGVTDGAVIESCPRRPSWTFDPAVEAAAPEDGAFPAPGPLQPRQARVYEFSIRLEGLIEPGKHVGIFSVTGHSQDRENRQGTVVASHEFTASIFGQKEILGPLGVTSLLLLPGFLIVVVFGLLLRWKPGREFPLSKDVKAPEFWLAAIVLSLIVAFVFWKIRGYTYLVKLRTGDIWILWAGSLAAAAVLWAIVLSVIAIRKSARTARQGARPK
jgi:membrane-bound inhibitor of C-type lysozyme